MVRTGKPAGACKETNVLEAEEYFETDGSAAYDLTNLAVGGVGMQGTVPLRPYDSVHCVAYFDPDRDTSYVVHPSQGQNTWSTSHPKSDRASFGLDPDAFFSLRRSILIEESTQTKNK